jgi:hypothetical protein
MEARIGNLRNSLGLPEPYDPAQNSPFQAGIHDLSLYHGKLYLTWGPAPVIVLLVPLHLIGLEPSTSLTAAVFAIAGLGFALAVLRVVLRQLGKAPLWMCVLAAFVLVLCSAVPFVLRRPLVYEEAVTAGYFFATAGVWLAVSALAERRASLRRLALMSLCFGLAAGSRPTLGLTALLLAPVYLSLRATRPRRGLLVALIAPVGGCLLLLAAYNQARYGNPLEIGVKYQLAGIDSYTAHFGDISYVPPGVWSYIMSPPRPLVLFPFLRLIVQPSLYPPGPPAHVAEPTGGLLPMTPIVIFLAALPWLWRRRPDRLGPLGAPLLLLAGAGAGILLFITHQFFNTTERYEVDFTTPLEFGALAAWLALSNGVRGRSRRLVRVGGGLLAVWSCFTGLAVSFTGYGNWLAVEHPGTWTALENAGSPLSRAITAVLGRPVLAEVATNNEIQGAPADYTGIDAPVKAFGLFVGEQAGLAIVSPDTREAVLTARMTPAVRVEGAAAPSAGAATLLVRDPGHPNATYTVPPGSGEMRIPVPLGGGLNRLAIGLLAGARAPGNPTAAGAPSLLVITNLSLAGG